MVHCLKVNPWLNQNHTWLNLACVAGVERGGEWERGKKEGGIGDPNWSKYSVSKEDIKACDGDSRYLFHQGYEIYQFLHLFTTFPQCIIYIFKINLHFWSFSDCK